MLIFNARSMNKYSTKRTSSNSFDSFNKHRRDYSPGRSHSRNSTPDSWSRSPRGPSSYSSKSYSRRSKDRDSKYYDGGSKSKYLRSSRSPAAGHESSSKSSYKNHQSSHSRESYYENNHTSSSYSSSSQPKRTHFGEWREQISKSGKIYFYNVKTECSQWGKPKEWEEWEKRHALKYSTTSSDKYSNSNYRDRYDSNSNYRDRYDTNSNSNHPKSYAYANDRHSSRERHKESYSTRHSSPNYRSHSSKPSRESDRPRATNDSKRSRDSPNDYPHKKTESSVLLKSTDSQCILNNHHSNSKSDKVRDSPLSNANSTTNNTSSSSSSSSSSSNSNNNHYSHRTVADRSGSSSTTNLQTAIKIDRTNLMETLASIVSTPGQVPMNITKIITQLTTRGFNLADVANESTLQLMKKALNLTQKSQQHHSTSNSQTHHHHNHQHLNSKISTVSNSNRNSTSTNHQTSSSPSSQVKHHSSSSSSKIHHAPSNRGANNADKQDSEKLTKSRIQSPETKNGVTNYRTENPTPSSSLSTISAAISSTVSQKSPVPNFLRFKHLYREDLVSHVEGWMSDQLEKQAEQLLVQENHIGNHLCTRVSSELKNARSLVRLTEIQTTLQKQRILFASQQIKLIEEWKGKNFANS